VVVLNTRDTAWCQYAYQFAHELCHIISRHELLRNNQNNWFHEAICELASFFVLRRMADTWLTQAPVADGPAWAGHLRSYEKERRAEYRDKLQTGEKLEGKKLGGWLAKHENTLRDNAIQLDDKRPLNAVVAGELLPLFEADPQGWNAVLALPASAGYIAEYLPAWYRAVEPSEQQFVRRIAEAFDLPRLAPQA
jgi:hypothetical protein